MHSAVKVDASSPVLTSEERRELAEEERRELESDPDLLMRQCFIEEARSRPADGPTESIDLCSSPEADDKKQCFQPGDITAVHESPEKKQERLQQACRETALKNLRLKGKQPGPTSLLPHPRPRPDNGGYMTPETRPPSPVPVPAGVVVVSPHDVAVGVCDKPCAERRIRRIVKLPPQPRSWSYDDTCSQPEKDNDLRHLQMAEPAPCTPNAESGILAEAAQTIPQATIPSEAAQALRHAPDSIPDPGLKRPQRKNPGKKDKKKKGKKDKKQKKRNDTSSDDLSDEPDATDQKKKGKKDKKQKKKSNDTSSDDLPDESDAADRGLAALENLEAAEVEETGIPSNEGKDTRRKLPWPVAGDKGADGAADGDAARPMKRPAADRAADAEGAKDAARKIKRASKDTTDENGSDNGASKKKLGEKLLQKDKDIELLPQVTSIRIIMDAGVRP